MRRKIPARKHHGVRDPIKQNEQRLAKLKDKINSPPEKDQRISYKFANFIKIKNDIKVGKLKKYKKSLVTGNGGGKEDKPKPQRNNQRNKKFKSIKMLPNESDEDYLKRVNRITTESLKESQYELKYGVNVIHNNKTGEVKVVKRPKNEIDEIIEKKKNKKKMKSTELKSNINSKLSKELLKKILNEKKEMKKLTDLQEYKRDIIKFGEVVHAPPTLTLPRKAKKEDTVPRPGKRNDLLLKSLLNDETTLENSKRKDNFKAESKSTPSADLNLKGKRKNLPITTRIMLEKQQNEVIEMYKELKKNKIKN